MPSMRQPIDACFVPAELPESWPVGDERYLPVPKAEFVELREQSLQPYSGIPPLPVRFGRAAYRAETAVRRIIGRFRRY